MKQKIIMVTLALISTLNLGAQTLFEAVPYLTGNDAEKLKAGEPLTRYFFSKDEADLRYILDFASAQTLSGKVRSLDPTLGVESLSLMPYPQGASKEQAYEQAAKILFSVSTMEGIEYYSASREKMRTLFTESTVIDSPESGRPLPDPHFETVPRSIDLTLRQTDLTFGTNIYATHFEGDGKTLLLEMSNMTKMKYKFISMVSPGDLSLSIVLYPVDEGILFYGVCSVNSISFFGLERKKTDSFYYRIEALKNWFENRYRVSVK